jgi:hypothetical protein
LIGPQSRKPKDWKRKRESVCVGYIPVVDLRERSPHSQIVSTAKNRRDAV